MTLFTPAPNSCTVSHGLHGILNLKRLHQESVEASQLHPLPLEFTGPTHRPQRASRSEVPFTVLRTRHLRKGLSRLVSSETSLLSHFLHVFTWSSWTCSVSRFPQQSCGIRADSNDFLIQLSIIKDPISKCSHFLKY